MAYNIPESTKPIKPIKATRDTIVYSTDCVKMYKLSTMAPQSLIRRRDLCDEAFGSSNLAVRLAVYLNRLTTAQTLAPQDGSYLIEGLLYNDEC